MPKPRCAPGVKMAVALSPELKRPSLDHNQTRCQAAGKGPLDEAASAMLAQLFSKHGVGARVVSYEEVSREEIGNLDVTGVVMVCVSYLDITGSPAHLRYSSNASGDRRGLLHRFTGASCDDVRGGRSARSTSRRPALRRLILINSQSRNATSSYNFTIMA